jgi:hypothetical protein
MDDMLPVFAAVLIAIGCFVSGGWSHYSTASSYEEQAINRGYALYCPKDGEFAWKGECK